MSEINSKSCPFCDSPNCHITKKQVLERGAIIEENVRSIMRKEYEGYPRTYAFNGVPAYDSLSALFPDEEEENPHAYIRFVYDEYEDCVKDWKYVEVANPLSFHTETEMLEKINNNGGHIKYDN